jgi:pyruvate dehydrogenase E2 component (dihydrolipoamide acetyltransferase)
MKEVLLPELAESVVEGEIVKWLVAEGESVQADQPLLEVMTDKVTVELPSPYAGVLRQQLVKEGQVVAVQTPLALIEEAAPAEPEEPDEGESLSLFKPSADDNTAPTVQVRRAARVAPSRATGVPRVLAVPAARKLARELGVDLAQVAGSGPHRRIRVEDIRAFSQAVPVAQAPGSDAEREERLPLRGLRRVIAKAMLASHQQTVRTLHVDEADVSGLVALREKLKPRAQAQGVKLTYLPLIMKAVVVSLRAYPILNASLDEAAGEIIIKRYYHLGVAVATEAGLVVPVIRDVDQKGILALAQELSALADKARAGKLAPEEVTGGSFSITNVGSLSGLFSFPIINVPEAAILGVHTIKKRPVVLPDDSIAARPMLYLSLSFDHRLIDGAEAANFTNHLIDLLETPEALLL